MNTKNIKKNLNLSIVCLMLYIIIFITIEFIIELQL
jgi:hypothetical protein